MSAATAPDTYAVPMEMEKEGIADVLSAHLGLDKRDVDTSWCTAREQGVYQPGNRGNREQIRYRGCVYQHQGSRSSMRDGHSQRK
ncbi:MAG: hypothetical protein MZV70_30590 [Desulfobacterales bacterium]|nr:hypothetical protein [Desulfobacterales bacterium]